ncbi:MAG: hypothetical protein QOJ81_727 [Chloroflexota bacterium]|nr:hypothetical protein [Chloroflexota bacterium]
MRRADAGRDTHVGPDGISDSAAYGATNSATDFTTFRFPNGTTHGAACGHANTDNIDGSGRNHVRH